MSYKPDASSFIPFYELDPSTQKQCIFITQKGERCKRTLSGTDNNRAIEIHQNIIAISSVTVDLDLLQEYIVCNCCRSGRGARHRDRIEDSNLLIPLAQRWQDEIRRNSALQSNHTTSVKTPEKSILVPSYYQSSLRPSSSINAIISKATPSSSTYQCSSPRSSIATGIALESSGSQPRYNLRPREVNFSTSPTTTRTKIIPRAPLSEFRPHIEDPRPSDSVSCKILKCLKGRDFKTGALYVFDRTSSPGHVKIGWTASSVSGRLAVWSKCGYTPNLLFSVANVSHAQRVETLTHHELIKEWRRERMCKAAHCGKSHQEWFEVSKDRAIQVLRDWADFMKEAEPYDSEGQLKDRWMKVIKILDGNRETVTAKKLLEYHKTSLVEMKMGVKESVNLERAPTIKKEVAFGYGSNIERLRSPRVELAHVSSLRIEQPMSSREATVLQSEALPKQLPLVGISHPKEDKQPKSDLLSQKKPLPKIELLPRTQLPRTQYLFTTKALSQDRPHSTAMPQFKKELLSHSGSAHELSLGRTQVKELRSELGQMALQVVDGLYNEISTGKYSHILKWLDGLKVPESEAPVGVKVVAPV